MKEAYVKFKVLMIAHYGTALPLMSTGKGN